MRHRSAAELALFEASEYDVHGRLYISGIPLHAALGKNPLRSATWGAAADQLVGSGTINLAREVDGQSLSPFLSSTLGVGQPDAGKDFILQTATVAKGATPGDGDYATVFDGEIDAVDTAGDEVALTCRDGFAAFDRIIEPGTEYYGWPVTGGSMLSVLQTLGTVMHPFSDPNAPNLPVVMVDGDPAWTVADYFQEAGVSMAEAMHAVVLQRGWAIHWRYTSANLQATGNPVAYDPERGGPSDPSSVYVVQNSEIQRYLKCKVDRTRVRNAVELIYGTDRARVKVEDATSIAAYGRRYMLLSEDATGQIDTAEEAGRMVEGALADLKDAGAEIDYERFYFWGVELGDLHTVMARAGKHPTVDVGVIGYSHSLNFRPNGQHRTTIRTTKRSAAAKVRWRKLDQRMVHVSLTPPTGIAPEGAIWMQTDDLSLP